MINLSAVVADLRAERDRAQKTLGQIDAALAALDGLGHGGQADEELCRALPEDALPQHNVLAGQNGKQPTKRGKLLLESGRLRR